MKKGLYFWRNKKTSGRTLLIVLIAIIALTFIGGGGYYYFVHIPQKKHQEELERQKVELQQKIAQVTQFYQKELAGGGTGEFTALLHEIYISRIPIELAGYTESTISCDANACSFTYRLNPFAVFNVQKKRLFGEDYASSFSEESLNYVDVVSKLNTNLVLESYQKNQDVVVPECGVLLNYINAYNSANSLSNKITIIAPPSSSITEVEKQVKSAKKYYGLQIGYWEISTSSDLFHIESLLKRQAFRQAFIIKAFSVDNGTAKVSGGFVCKNGN
jgi:hypothetical protein